MGYIVSSLTDPSVTPEIFNEYCIYLIHEWGLIGISKSLSGRFREYGRRLGHKASIFAASNQESYDNSLIEIFRRDPWFKITLGNYYNLHSGIIITKPGLPQFSADTGHVFIYVSSEVINLAYHYEEELSQDLIDLCRHDQNIFINKILHYSRGSIVDSGPRTNSLLETIRDSIMIEPNINGFGFRISPIVDYAMKNGFLRDRPRESEDTVNYDCVIYRY